MARPLILAFDTSSAQCAAALLSGDTLLAERAEPMAKGQAERLFPLIEEMLATAGAGWADICRIGVGVGPGNFTGVRLSVAAARGLALSLGVPALGVTVLDAAALDAPGRVLAIRDARAGRLYAQPFDDGAAAGPPALIDADDLPALAMGRRLICPDPAPGGLALPVHPPAQATAPAIARIAAARTPGARPAPLYLRAPDAAPPSDPPPVILASVTDGAGSGGAAT